jgi:hypothetical protein
VRGDVDLTPWVVRDGRAGALFVAPHAYVPLETATPLIRPDPAVQAELADRIADWHDLGTLEALDAATARAGSPGLRPTLPRGLVDLNRGWRPRTEATETLFGKGALDAWTRTNLAEGADAALEGWYRSAMSGVREAAQGARVLVELHSYGDLGSTYDRNAGGRPMLRSEASVVHGAPWASAFPVGISRWIPANLRGTPWALEARLGAALDAHGITLGPSPYPIQLPWTISARFLAERWFRWLGRTGRLPAATADALVDRAWTDELSDGALDGTDALVAEIGAWSHTGAELAAAFRREDGSATLGVELRIDLRDRAGAFGDAVAEAVVGFGSGG